MAFRLCEHIKTDGIRCHSPAKRDRKYCHYHTLYRKRGKIASGTPSPLRIPMTDAKGNYMEVDMLEGCAKRYVLGALEDGPALQVAISTVVNALADNRLDLGRASTLLYGLQLASTNLRNFQVDDTPTGPETSDTPATASTAGTYAQVPPEEELGPDPEA